MNDEPPPPLTYVDGSTELDGAPVADVERTEPAVPWIGAGSASTSERLAPGATVTISVPRAGGAGPPRQIGRSRCGARSRAASRWCRSTRTPGARSRSRSSRARVAAIPGVAAADMLAFVDLPPGSLSSPGLAASADPVRVFAFDRLYRAHYPSIRIIAGDVRARVGAAQRRGSPSARCEPRHGDRAATFRAARPRSRCRSVVSSIWLAPSRCSTSRKSAKLEDFLYVPDSLVVTPSHVQGRDRPGLGRARRHGRKRGQELPGRGARRAGRPLRLATDPGVGARTDDGLAQAIERIGPSTDLLIDNISNALAVARDDAAVGKRMFLFLGVPGLLLAAFLTAYAGGILAAVQRREHAILRVRGAHRGHLRRIAVYRSADARGRRVAPGHRARDWDRPRRSWGGRRSPTRPRGS